MKRSLLAIFHPGVPAKPSARMQRLARPIERLEDRIAPANNVLANLVGGTLTITTVDDLSETAVLAGDNNQNFQVLAGALGAVTLHKSGNTNINGGVADVPFTGVQNIVFDLKEGDDSVTLKGGVKIDGDVTFKSGDGDGLINIDGDGGLSQMRNLTYTGGNGLENITFLDGDVTFTGKVSLNLGDGASNVNIGFNVNDSVNIAGPLSVTAGAGSDIINFNGNDLVANGPVTMKLGSGDNNVRFKLAASLVLNKAVSVTSGADDDVFAVDGPTNATSLFGAGLTINAGNGNNTVSFDSAGLDKIVGNLVVTNGAGNDAVIMNSGSVEVTGMVKIVNGQGNNSTDFSPTGLNKVGGSFSVTSLSGDDTTTIGGATVDYQAVKLVNGNGASTTTLSGTNLSFASIASTSGEGTDAFNITASGNFNVLTGGLTLKNGFGATTTTVSAVGTVGVAGALSIVNGEGVDTQTFTGGNFSGLHNVSIANGGGDSTATFNPAQLTITGLLKVTAGDGFDTFKIGTGVLTTFAITGSIDLKYGGGGSTTALAPTTSGNVSGGFKVTALDDNDSIDLFRTAVGGAVALSLGAGNDDIEINNAALHAVTLTTGSGNDIVKIENTLNDAVSTTILGAFTADFGTGDDSIFIGLDADDRVATTQTVKINGGLGLDTFNQGAAANAFSIAPALVSVGGGTALAARARERSPEFNRLNEHGEGSDADRRSAIGDRETADLFPNLEEVESSSPGLRGTSYPGNPPQQRPNPERVVSSHRISHVPEMAQSLAKILLHLVFSTKERRPFLRDEGLRTEMHGYLGGILNHLDGQPLIVGGVEDHVHLLIVHSRTATVAEVVKELKRGSAVWLKTRAPELADFAWQSGYGVFSIGQSQVEDVRAYIAGQEEHHRKISFQDEFRRLLQRYEIEFDERYMWD